MTASLSPQAHSHGLARPTCRSACSTPWRARHRHLDPAFVELMEQIKSMLRMAFQTQNALTFPVSAPGRREWKCASSTW